MDETKFWNLIEQTRDGKFDCERQARKLQKTLSALSAAEILEFNRYFIRFHEAAYRWDLWGAFYIVNGGGSEDGFHYFRCWLVGQGKTAYENALADPETLGDLVDDDKSDTPECGDIWDAVDLAYEAVTGKEMPPNTEFRPGPPAGKEWEYEELETMFPKLWER